ncbi:AhpC/TSA family protein [Thalassomonas viridans]|uniref:thioredoxin-dependent peroxiredoxin n=1 Tax=Thalassomonas viridans TaxID=137584 RepID=A0AAE9Z518_9GAMM|nr:peroxiredoxin-like family protein [Thalassomonas viridans]WDE06184.1 AhpC/TSA family protein [Thalassomonas viridans]
MSLQDQLNAFKEQFKKQAPEAAFNAFARSTQELIESGQAEKALKAGNTAPDFMLTDPEDNEVALEDLLAKGPVVLSFYRGVWCPYCNIELQALEAAADEIRAKGATLVAVSMQGAADSRKSQRDNNLSFPILTDQAGELAEKFGIRWAVQDYVIEFKKMFNVVLPNIHGDGEWNLPMPARYVIDTNGTIAYAEVNPDYTQRPEPSDLFPVLDSLTETA